MIKMREKTDWGLMARVRGQFKDGVKETTREVAEAVVNDIRASWANSPSSMGGPPAIDTGNLDSAIHVSEQGRDDSGRFAGSDNVTTYYVRANASEGDKYHGRGNYSRALEERYNRPFIAPAVYRASLVFGGALKRRVAR